MKDKSFKEFFLRFIKDTSDAVIITDENGTVEFISGAAAHILPGVSAGGSVAHIIRDGGGENRVEFYEYDAEAERLEADDGVMLIYKFPKSTYAVTHDYPPLGTAYADMIERLVSAMYNPLSVIFSSADTVKKEADGEVKKELHSMIQNGYRLLKTADNIAAISRAGQSEGSDDKAAVHIDAAAFILKTAASVSGALKKRGIILDTSAVRGRVFVKADEYRLERILLLFIANAAKRASAGGTIRISIFEMPAYAAVSIAGTGRPMDGEEIKKTFSEIEPLSYDMLDTAAAKLYIEELSGTMVIDTNKEGASRITFTLPRGSAADALFQPKRIFAPKGRFERRFIDLSDVVDYEDLW
ncbi:MAG: HAMP domain-containing histidine kinase [Clostridia bacterium]|nr:HAMP domain-containing histidine kinase [Clostridia bacterium]